MVSAPFFKKCDESLIPLVIEFCNGNGFTYRTHSDWVESNLQAVLAFDGARLIGAIPFYPRRIKCEISNGSNFAYLTSVAIDPHYRNNRIGSSLLEYLYSSFSLEGVFVNSDPVDLSHEWYKKNQFENLAEVKLLAADIKKLKIKKHPYAYIELKNSNEIAKYSEELNICFNKNMGIYSGYEVRDKYFWEKKIQTHYYRHHYKYFLIFNQCFKCEQYSIIGLNTDSRRVKSLDVLEIAPVAEDWGQPLLSTLIKIAEENGVKTIRIPCIVNSETEKFCYSSGFKWLHSFNILYYGLKTQKSEFNNFMYFHFDYA
jgi:GNAT superfamily N-acetyltransferase